MLALPQDVQAEEFDFPVAMFEPRLHRVPRQRPDRADLADARRDAPQRASGRCSCVGGGVRYSGAAAEALAFAEAHGVPVVETVAGRTLVPHEHRLYGGALGIIGSTSANDLAAEADVVLAVGTRLQDFTTSSWTGFAPGRPHRHGQRRPLRRGQARGAGGRGRRPGDAGRAVGGPRRLDRRRRAGPPQAAGKKAGWDAHVDGLREGVAPDGSLTYAQVVGVVNDASGPDDYVLTASGGMPGELHGGWRTGDVKHDGSPTSGATMDLEYGFSCMGYEVVAPWGAAMARAQTHPDGLVTALFGDGSYLMLNSELYSAAFAGHPYVAVLCDNAGYAVIHRLQTNQGADGFNNMLADSRGPGADGSVRVDFAAHARSLGLQVEDVPAAPASRSCGRRTSARGTAARTSGDRPSWCAGPTPPPGPRPAPGGRPGCPGR